MYISGKDFYKEMVISKAKGILTKEAQDGIYLIAKNLSGKFGYKDPEWRKDCLQEGLLMAYKYWMKFEEERSTNAFGYFTEIIKRGMASGFNKVSKNYETNVSIEGFYEDGGIMNI
jgi:hypothetical protein